MDVAGKKVETQVQFWSLLGPFFVLLSITILLFKVSPHWYFPVCGLIGIPLCLKWKMKGLALSLGCLFVFSGLNYQNLELDDRYWHVGLSLAMAFSFIVLTLSLEEVQGVVSKLQLESQSRLDNFLLVDEKWKMAENDWSSEIKKLKAEADVLSYDIARVQEEKQTFYKLAQLAKDELIHVKGEHDKLLQDLLYKKQQIAQYHERLEENEATIQEFVNSAPEKTIESLKAAIDVLEQEKETLKARAALAQKERETCVIEKERLLEELHSCQEKGNFSLVEREELRQAKDELQNRLLDEEEQSRIAKDKLQNQILSLQDQCNLLEKEKEKHFQKQSVLEHDLKEKCELLTQVQHQVARFNNELNEERSNNQHFLANKQKIESLNEELKQELSRLQDKLNQEQSISQQSLESKHKLESLNEGLKQEVANLKLELEKKEEMKLSLQLAPAKESKAISSNSRGFESMYHQLKTQFQEKCAVLDATRRELFVANEALLNAQKDKDERLVYDLPYNEKQMQKHLIRLGKQLDQMQANYQQEVDDLTSLVGHLLKQIKIS